MKTSTPQTLRAVCLALSLVSPFSGPFITSKLEHSGEASAAHARADGALSKSKVSDAYHKLPLSFEENRGQADRLVKYVSHGRGYSVFLNATEAVVELRPDPKHDQHVTHSNEPRARAKAQLASVRLKLVRANAKAEIKGVGLLPGKTNYFIGNDPKRWRTNVPAYAKVICSGVYPGVDLVYYGNQRQLEYDLILAPGADPAVIRLELAGAKRLRVDELGDLVMETETGEIRQHRPVAYQERNGGTQQVSASYVIRHGNEASFEIGDYDTSKPLVIDPVLSYSTYLGGDDEDEASGITVDSDGNAYVTGATSSAGFPTVGGLQSGRSGDFVNSDVFITKLNPAGTALLYSTYLGGIGADEAYGIAVDSAGSAYVTGETYSVDFPTSDGAFQRKNAGAEDAFVARLSPRGDALVYSTYLGGEGILAPGFYYSPNKGSDTAFSIAVDSDGSAYVTGRTFSSDFPTKRPLQATINGGTVVPSVSQPPPLPPVFSDAFVTKLSPSGKDLVYSTLLGGTGNDEARGVAVDASGSAYVVGFASIGGAGSPGSLQPVFGGGLSDAFVVRLAPSGKAVIFSTWLGGSGSDKAFGVALDDSGNCYVTGETDSANFPTTPGAFRTRLSGASFFRSTDGGSTWSPSATGLPALTTDHVKVDPSTAATVYAGFIGRYPTPGGVFKSTDGGANWSAINDGLPSIPGFLNIASMAIDPTHPSTLYVLSAGHVFKSIDGGKSWSSADNRSIYLTGQLTIDPMEPTTIYAGANVCPIAAPGPAGAKRNAQEKAQTIGPQDLLPPGYRALFKSTDGGATWSPTAFPSCAIGWLVIDPRKSGTLYSGYSSILKSTDGGNNWSRRSPEVFATVLAVDPMDSAILYAVQSSNALAKLLKSTDGGETWKDSGAFGVGVNALAIDPSNPSTIYAGTGSSTFDASYDYFNPIPLFGFGGGVFKTTDGGASWRITSLDGVAIKQLAVSPSDPSTLYAGAFQDSDAFITKINANGSAIIYSTYLGGTGRDAGFALAVDTTGNAYVTGQTYSADFPTREAIQSRRASRPANSGAFVARLNGQGQTLVYSTHLGGSGDSSGNGDIGRAIAVDPFGKVYVAGVTGSNDFPIKTSIQRESGGEEDAFVARIVLPPKIRGVSISGKNLVLTGESFDKDAVILLDGVEYNARNDGANPSAVLIGKKLAKKIAPGQTVKLRVKNSDGEVSEEFVFVR